MSEKFLTQISEATYLTTENAWRYRAILRYFYLQHERLRHYLYPEEVFEYLKELPHFENYTEEQLQQDLSQLTAWKNLIPRQDIRKPTSIEEFKKKKLRYQCTPYTIEIERMVQNLEQLGSSFGGSLEKAYFVRILEALLKLLARTNKNEKIIYSVEKLPNDEVFALWDDLYGNFRKLTENATDYLANLQSEKVEEMMLRNTEAFLVYKESLTSYLRGFMTVLQRTSLRIEGLLHDAPRIW